MAGDAEKERLSNPAAHTEAEWLATLADLARFLRTSEGCPWDREQSARDFAQYLQEESREFLEAFDGGDPAEELGDTLFCLLAAAAAAEESGQFRLIDALKRVHEKMIRRHAHVFGDQHAGNPDAVKELWDAIKREEKRDPP